MAYTESQWNKFQSQLPPEERTSYLDYLQETNPAEYNRVVGVILQNLKTAELQSNTTVTKVLDEGTKIAGAKADKAGQKAAQVASTKVLSNFKAAEAATGTPAAVPISAVESTAAATAAANAGKTPEQLAAEEEARQAAAAQANAQLGLSEEELARLANLEKADRLALEAARMEEKNAKTQAAYARFLKKQPLSAEDKALLDLGADFEYPVDTEGNPIITDGDTPPDTDGDTPPDDKPGKQPGAAWILSADGKSWIKPPQPNPTDTWDDEKGWVSAAGDSGGPGKQPGKAWVLSADGKSWIKPLMPTEAGKSFSWDDEKGWIGFTVGSSDTKVTEVSRVTNADGSITVTYSDGTTKVFPKIGGGPDASDVRLISTYVDDATGDTIGYFSDGSRKVLNKGNGPVRSEQFKDAYALLKKTFADYDLEELVPIIQDLMDRGVAPEQATLELRASDPYKLRFKGNTLRLASGRNALSEAEYLATENAYNQTLKAYGQQNYFGIDRKVKQAKMAEIIGNDINADEFRSRVDLAVARVQNADPTIKKLLKEFYPSLNDADLVGYFLNPTEGLPKLTEKVTSAEIGSAFLGQGLAYTQQRSAELAQYGLDRAGALKGASEIKQVLPESQKLGDIYGESGIVYNQRTGEEEFIKDNQDAATKRKRLASMERGSFSGSAGNAPGAYSTGYLKKSSTAGLI